MKLIENYVIVLYLTQSGNAINIYTRSVVGFLKAGKFVPVLSFIKISNLFRVGVWQIPLYTIFIK
jgi:hypothetical protein